MMSQLNSRMRNSKLTMPLYTDFGLFSITVTQHKQEYQDYMILP